MFLNILLVIFELSIIGLMEGSLPQKLSSYFHLINQ